MLGRVAQIENVYRFWLEPPNVFLIQGLGRRLRRSAAHAHGLWKIADCCYGSASGQGTKLRYYLGNGAPRHCGSPQCPAPYSHILQVLQISRFPDFQVSTFSFPDFYIFISIFHLPSWVLAGGAAVKGFFLGACWRKKFCATAGMTDSLAVASGVLRQSCGTDLRALPLHTVLTGIWHVILWAANSACTVNIGASPTRVLGMHVGTAAVFLVADKLLCCRVGRRIEAALHVSLESLGGLALPCGQAVWSPRWWCLTSSCRAARCKWAAPS